MATMDTAYLPNGGLQTTTSGGPAGGGGGDGMMAALLPMLLKSMEMKQAKAAELARRDTVEYNTGKQRQAAADKFVPINQAYGNPVKGAGSGGGREAAPVDMLSMQRAAMEGEQMMQDRLPPPMRLINGPGIISGMGMDVNAMNAAQRRSFLPDKSGEVEDSGGMQRRAMDFKQKQIDDDRAEAKKAGLSGGGRSW
jgi:hypothetical protein